MNLLFDSLNKPNLDLDYLDSTWYGYFQTGTSYIPQIFYPYRDLIQLYDIEQIDDLDFFKSKSFSRKSSNPRKDWESCWKRLYFGQ